MRELIAERRRSPRDDLVSALVEARVDGGRLSDAEIVSTVIVLLNAGHEATVNTLGNGIRALMHHRDQWQRLVDGSVPAAAALEELIRYDPPLQLFERWVLEDGVEVGGSRDPARREDRDAVRRGEPRPAGLPRAGSLRCRASERGRAHRLRRRHPRVHRGPAGARRARGGLRALVERCPGLELAEEPERNPAFVIWGLRSVEVGSAESPTPAPVPAKPAPPLLAGSVEPTPI